jgi:hypothetical protein
MSFRTLVLILLPAAGILLVLLYAFSGSDAEFFAEGDAVLPAPRGNRIAVRGDGGRWRILDAARRVCGEFTARGLPLWIPDAAGDRMVYRDERGLWMIRCRPGEEAKSLCILESSDLHPEQALRDGRILVTRGEEGANTGFSLIAWDAASGKGEETLSHALEDTHALRMRASPMGRRIGLALPGEAGGVCIRVLNLGGPGPRFQEVLLLPDVRWPEFYWSGSGELLIFASRGGGVEVHDFFNNERRWLMPNTYHPLKGCPFKVTVSADDGRVIIPTVDDYGYRQITIFERAAGKETRFSHGWADHYGLVASRDFRYFTYRQCAEKVPEREVPGSALEESIYIFDSKEGLGRPVYDRPLLYEGPLHGPSLSGEADFVFFVDGNRIFRYALHPE